MTPTQERPLSPHLQIYRPQLTSVLSIMHRFTGFVLVFGALLLVGWLWAAAYSPACFAGMHRFFMCIIGKLILGGWVLAFYYHLFNGLRHLFWDISRDIDIPASYRNGYMMLAATVIVTAIVFFGYILPVGAL